MRDHTPIPLQDYQGLLNRGPDEMVSQKHFVVAKNLIFPGRSVRSRYGFTSTPFGSIPGIKRIHVYKRIGEADRFLILDTTGKLWDSTNPLTPIHDDPDWVDFACVSMYNRAYISPHNGDRGLPGEFIYVYEGSGVIRKIGGLAPATSPTIANSPDAGNVSQGWHQYAVSFETSTGFITKFSTPVPFNSSGGKKVRLTNIPTGPANTISRYILSSKNLIDYNAAVYNPLDYEMFFVSDGKIPDNTTTTLDINFFDSSLVDSADYLYDMLAEVPAGVFLTDMDGRLVSGGSNTDESVARLSLTAEPEAFSDVDGFLLCNPGSGFGLKNAKAKRGTYYFFKDRRYYTTFDTGNPPNSWRVQESDVGSGTGAMGISMVVESKGDTDEFFLFADRTGLQAFRGSIDPFPLTWKINDIWEKVNSDAWHLVQVYLNADQQEFFVSVPLNNSITPNAILYADYSEGLSYDTIKWSIWQFAQIHLGGIFMNINNVTKRVEFRCHASDSNKYYLYTNTTEADEGAFKNIQVDFPFVGNLNRNIDLHHFSGIRMRISGVGSINTVIKGLDGVITEGLGSDNLSPTPGAPLDILSDLSMEKASYSITMDSLNGWFLIQYATVYAMPVWSGR